MRDTLATIRDFILVTCFILMVAFMYSPIYGRLEDYEKAYLGKTIVINGQERVITNLHYGDAVFELDNGSRIDVDLVNDMLKEK